jgi:hypothetical protein
MQIAIGRCAAAILRKTRMGAVAALALLAPTVWAASFHINLNFTGGLTASQEAVFVQVANLWQSLLPEYQPGVNISGLTINASGTFIDGVGGTLGQAGPSPLGLRRQGGYWLSTRGTMQFDSADIAAMESNGSFMSVVMHEMAHVMGFGTLWALNGVYQTGSGRYTGANAVAAARVEVNRPGLTFVPVELGGGAGTANGHWDERDGGVCCTGFTNSSGQDATFELMTGWLNAPVFVSQTTLQSFVDIGYVAAAGPVSLAALAGEWESPMATLPVGLVPEPESYMLLLAGIIVLGCMARRRSLRAA